MKRGLVLLIVAALVLAAVGLVSGRLALNPGGTAEPVEAATTKVIHMSAVEYKGSTNIASEPFPSGAPPPGGGYRLNAPDAGGNWSTSTYRWEPGTVVVNRGDRVELWIWGVNGAVHDSHIEGYVPEFTVQRGQLTVVSFTANKAGTFKIHCSTHEPSMEAELVVLPFPSR